MFVNRKKIENILNEELKQVNNTLIDLLININTYTKNMIYKTTISQVAKYYELDNIASQLKISLDLEQLLNFKKITEKLTKIINQ